MNSRRFTPALLAFALALLPSAAFAGEALADCVELGNDREIVRPGGQQFLLRDGTNHYRVSLLRSCDSLSIASRIDISTDDQANRLCPADTRIRTDRDTCRVASVETMTAEEFAKRKKRAAR